MGLVLILIGWLAIMFVFDKYVNSRERKYTVIRLINDCPPHKWHFNLLKQKHECQKCFFIAGLPEYKEDDET